MQQRLLTRYWLLVGLTVILLMLALAVSNRLVISTLVERQEKGADPHPGAPVQRGDGRASQ